jgi:sulfur carrier protein ThiS
MHNALKKNPSTVIGMDKIRISFKEGLTIEDIINKFELQEVGLVVVNGRISPLEYIIQEEDTIEFHPMFGGG